MLILDVNPAEDPCSQRLFTQRKAGAGAIGLYFLYAPSFYLGELYLLQTLLKKNLTVAAGSMAPINSFASLPVFSNYVNYGINPNPSSLGTNDVSFFGPPTGTEWGAPASYTITPAIEAVAGTFNTNTHSANGRSGAEQKSRMGVVAGL